MGSWDRARNGVAASNGETERRDLGGCFSSFATPGTEPALGCRKLLHSTLDISEEVISFHIYDL